MIQELFQSAPSPVFNDAAQQAGRSSLRSGHPLLALPPQWTKVADFWVPGHPSPGGSKKASFIPKRGGGFVTRPNGSPIIAVRDAGGEKTKNWRAVVAHEARIAHQGDPFDGTLILMVEFVMQRPKGHYRGNGTLKPSAPTFHTSRPDALKLTRSTEDALTGILYRDDSLIAAEFVIKTYGSSPGAGIKLWRLEERSI